MKLPTIDNPTFSETLPVTGEKIEYHAYTGVEEKILMQAKQSGEPSEVINSIRTVVGNCTSIDGKSVELDKVPLFIAGWIFLRLRIRSVGETAEMNIECPHCNKKVPTIVDLDAVRIIHDPDISPLIQLTPEVAIEMGYPLFGDFATSINNDGIEINEVDMLYQIMRKSIRKVIDGDKVLHAGQDFNEAEVEEFIDQFTGKEFQKLMAFYDNLPTVKYTHKFTCLEAECGKGAEYTFDSIFDFFI